MQGKRVLLVENDRNESAAMTDIFLRCGHQLCAVDSGYAALNELSTNRCDIVFSEFNLPRMSGIELMVKIKESNSALPVILIAGDASVNDAVIAMKKGADNFIVKPLTRETIQSVISAVPVKSMPKDIPAEEGKYQIITKNREINRLLHEAGEIARSRASVFIHGESGTGKELLARYIHRYSDRRDKPFVAVNCAALPETLMESELFGYEKGAFTGAIARKKGKFEAADKGTILLDEISEMDFQLQSKLLRVLQEREIDRVGGSQPVPVDVRVIATTNRNIDNYIAEGKFREDLYYRLNTIPLNLPPLRERRDDIPMLAEYFLKKYNMIENRNVKSLTEEALSALSVRVWKGNVRELENIIERAVLMCRGDVLDEKDLFLNGRPVIQEPLISHMMPGISLREVEKKVIFQALDSTNGNRTHAADILGISVRTLRNKLNEYREKMGGQ
jgi:two-component system response regulator FlrC